MAHSSKETLTLAWCDGGMVDGRFMDGLLYTTMTALASGIKVVNKIRVNGNQIGRQRQVLFDNWADVSKSDWLLWIDSDIVISPEVFKLVWDAADKVARPVVSGTYFVSKENEKSLMQPFPALFMEGNNKNELQIIHPLPINQLIQVDSAGFGFLLMHKSIIPKLRSVSPDYSLFAEEQGIGDKYISEDIVFFRKLKAAGVDLYAHTGAVVQHMKRFSFDINYYNLYWNGLQKELFTK
jgi:glycosyltransferase involved in cell wall biosynthesis